MNNIEIQANSFSPRQFAKRNGIGVTKTYSEIKWGRLNARKCGARTIITVDDERAWLDSLPTLIRSRGCNQEEKGADNE